MVVSLWKAFIHRSDIGGIVERRRGRSADSVRGDPRLRCRSACGFASVDDGDVRSNGDPRRSHQTSRGLYYAWTGVFQIDAACVIVSIL